MEAGVKELRDNLSRYLSVVREGQEVTVTDHGKAVARLVPLDQPRLIDRLIASGGAARFARRFLEAKGLGPAADALGRFDAADVLPFPNTKTNSAEGEAA